MMKRFIVLVLFSVSISFSSPFVKSVEKVSVDFGTTSGVTSIIQNLSKGQDETQCVPFNTNRSKTSGSDIRFNEWVGIEMIDNGGTPAVKVHRNALVTVNELHVDIFVVEFVSVVTIQQGNVTSTSTSTTATITAVTETNSFIVFGQVGEGTPPASSDDWNDTKFQASFNSTTEIVFERRAAEATFDWIIYWYVVESNGTDFTTQYIEQDWTATETGPTDHTISAVTLANAFIIVSYETAEPSDDMQDASANFALTTTTKLTFYRDDAVGRDGTFGIWVVKTDANGANVQRFAKDLTASTTNTQAITSIDQAKTIIINSHEMTGGSWSVDATTNGPNIQDRMNSLVFTSNTEVTLQQELAEASDGTGSLRFEVVEFELESAAVPSRIIIVD